VFRQIQKGRAVPLNPLPHSEGGGELDWRFQCFSRFSLKKIEKKNKKKILSRWFLPKSPPFFAHRGGYGGHSPKN